MKKIIYRKQSGEVSLFVVIFAALLLTIVTVSFVRIMVNNQQQASTIDLSQSAYDSAQAGVEDAKRAVLYYQSVCGDLSKVTECNAAKLAAPKCNASVNLLSDIKVSSASSPSEIKIQNGNNKNSLDQAYTCTTITFNTTDVGGTLIRDSYDVVPLQGVDNSFDTVKIEWFMSTDHPSSLSIAPGVPLSAAWPQDKPPILRAQLIQYDQNGGFSLGELNDVNGSLESNANTVFLYPSSAGINSTLFATADVRRSVNPGLTTGSPFQVKCNIAASALYACTVNLKLPKPIHNSGNNRVAFLRLGVLYNQATYHVQLINSSVTPNTVVNFNGVEPIIDSTGRANDLFRRVQARVKLSSDFTYPNAEIYTNGNFCKEFLVTNVTDGYVSTCTP